MIDNSGLIQPQFLEIENPLIEGSFNEFYREDKSFYIIILYSNQLRELRNARREAFFLNTVFFLCSLGKVTLVILLFMKTEEKCFGPLLLWLILMFIHDLLNCFTLMRLNYEIIILVPTTFLNQMNDPLNPDDSYQNIDITLHSYVRQQIHSSRLTGFDINQNLEKTDKCLSIFIELCRLFYFVLFVYGNVVFFSDNICTKEVTPYFWEASLIFLVMGYLYLAVPLIIFSLFCFCLPFILIFFLCINNRRRVGRGNQARESFLNSLIPNTYAQIDEKENECCICMVDYKDEDEMIVLPCNKKHSFHANCVRTWLSINGVCPICRKNFVEEPVRQ